MDKQSVKVYVNVLASFDTDGRLRPIALLWEDGRRYHIDRVLDMRAAASLRAGGQGDRYTIRVGTHESYLFFERSPALSGAELGRWFVERRGA